MITPQHITLRQLQNQVKQTLETVFAQPQWVSAEIAEIKVNYSGHCYIELVEKGGQSGGATAQARAVIWRSAYPCIEQRFESETGQRLGAGIKILAKVMVTYHELYGFSLQITDIDPTYTLGELERQRQLTISQLKKEGVWDMNREVAIERVVQRIAVVSSANAAGYQDFYNEIEKSAYRFEITLFDAYMQGAAAEESIVAALCAVADRQEEFDAVVIIRGGGSANDLSCFNSYMIAAYVAQFPLPVISGIGHDKDVSVVDMVAHTPLKTPTAVAGWLIERMTVVDGWLESAALLLHKSTTTALREQDLILERITGEIKQRCAEVLMRARVQSDHLNELLPKAVADFVARQRSKIEAATELCEVRSPERILQLGFAVVRSAGKSIKSTQGIAAGHRVSVELAEGELDATINSITICKPKR